MAGRIRTLKPEWLDDELLAASDDAARVLSAGLILLADDHGNGRAAIAHLAAEVWRYEFLDDNRVSETLAKARAALSRLVEVRFVELYEVNGQRYFHIRTWAKNQRVDHPGKERVPSPTCDGARTIRENLASVSREPRESLAPDLRSPISDLRSPTNEDPGSCEPGLLLPPSTPIDPPAPQNAPDAAPVAADSRDPKRQAEIRAVHEHYLAGWHRVVSGTRAPILDRTRAGKIRARLAEGYSQEDLCRAIDGMWASEWHVENRRWDLELVVRDAKHVDQFLAKAPAPVSSAPATQLPPAEPAWVLRERAAAAAQKPCAPPADLPRIGQLDLVTTGDVIAERLARLATKEGSA